MERRRGRSDDLNNTEILFSEQNEAQTSNSHRTNFESRGSWKDDKINIIVLLLLYILQGIPLGLGGSLPLILQNYKVSYKQLAVFSLVQWPFSVKLLWAPIVDSTYWSRIGRRKSWLIPTQYLIGLTMIILSSNVSSLLGDGVSEPNVILLTCAFFLMNVLAATQDIAVDGWALTMLSRHNIGYASTCNSVGQTAGYFFGNVVFLALESADFCNTYLRTEPQSEGIVTLSSFMIFWAYIYFITTTLVAVFKRETIHHDDAPVRVYDAYKMLYRVLCLKNVLIMIAVLMTCKMGFAATDAATGLKLIEAGMKKERIALLAVPMVPLQLILPFLISKYTSGPTPLMVFLKAYPYRLLCGIIFAIVLWGAPLARLESGGFPLYYYGIIIFIYALHQITVYSIFVSLMAFFARVSDPSIGGTYMTLLNTMCNLGGNWPATLSLWWIDMFTFKDCQGAPHLSCDTKEMAMHCENSGGTCRTTLDGYYIETAMCIVLGFLWFKFARRYVLRLQQDPLSSWLCRT